MSATSTLGVIARLASLVSISRRISGSDRPAALMSPAKGTEKVPLGPIVCVGSVTKLPGWMPSVGAVSYIETCTTSPTPMQLAGATCAATPCANRVMAPNLAAVRHRMTKCLILSPRPKPRTIPILLPANTTPDRGAPTLQTRHHHPPMSSAGRLAVLLPTLEVSRLGLEKVSEQAVKEIFARVADNPPDLPSFLRQHERRRYGYRACKRYGGKRLISDVRPP